MNLNIRNIDPEARGLLYRLQGEKGFANLADTIEFVMKISNINTSVSSYMYQHGEQTYNQYGCGIAILTSSEILLI